MQHFQCWCYSYPTSTCLTANTLTSARATSVLTHLIKNDKLVKIKATQVAEKFSTGDEKYYAKSEIDILNEVNNSISNTEDKYKSQKSYYNRKEVPYGTKDSVRPEGRSDGLNRTIEVKNYDIDKNSSSMISKIVEQAKAQNITMQEIYDLAKKEGLNVGKLDDAGISGVGQKFDIVGNGKEKIEIKINGKKIERNVLSIRSNSGGIHNSSYILIGTDDGKLRLFLEVLKNMNIILQI